MGNQTAGSPSLLNARRTSCGTRAGGVREKVTPSPLVGGIDVPSIIEYYRGERLQGFLMNRSSDSVEELRYEALWRFASG